MYWYVSRVSGELVTLSLPEETSPELYLILDGPFYDENDAKAALDTFVNKDAKNKPHDDKKQYYYITQDDDYQYFVLPIELYDEFEEWLDKMVEFGSLSDDYQDKFSQYRIQKGLHSIRFSNYYYETN